MRRVYGSGAIMEAMLDLAGEWDRVLELAWLSYVHGSTPIGALLLDGRGERRAEARSRRYEEEPLAGQLVGSRLAHAELNALAAIRTREEASDYTLLSSMEPCSLCMGAAYQAGIGRLIFAAPDPYAGATRSISLGNEQLRRRRLAIEGPIGGPTELLSRALSYTFQAAGNGARHVAVVLRAADPDLVAIVGSARVEELLRGAAASQQEWGEVKAELLPLLVS